MSPSRLVLGTRGSPLALWQAESTAAALRQAHPDLDIHLEIIHTKGDKILDKPLAAIGDKGLFTKELENALYDGRIDLAVHSLKDLPTTLPEGLTLSAMLAGQSPFDALVTAQGEALSELPHKALVGTGSLRRQTQLQALRPDLRFADLRGNIQTRLGKLDRGDYQAIVMAHVALERMGLAERISHRFSAEEMLPAVGQGVIGFEIREDDSSTHELLQAIHDAPTAQRCLCERAYLKRLGGGCEKPIAGYAVLENQSLHLTGFIGAMDGSQSVRQSLSGSVDKPEQLGIKLAENMLKAGGAQILGLS